MSVGRISSRRRSRIRKHMLNVMVPKDVKRLQRLVNKKSPSNNNQG